MAVVLMKKKSGIGNGRVRRRELHEIAKCVGNLLA